MALQGFFQFSYPAASASTKLQPRCNSKGMIKNTGQTNPQPPFKIPASILSLGLPLWVLRQVNETVAKHLGQALRLPATDGEIAREVNNLYPELQGTSPASKRRHQVRACARETIIHAIAASHIEVEGNEVFGGEQYAKTCEMQLPPATGAGVSVTTERALADAAKSAEEDRARKRRQEESQQVLQWLSDCFAALREYEVQECEKLAQRLADKLRLLATEPER